MTTSKRILAALIAYVLIACLSVAYAAVVVVSFVHRRWPRNPR